MPIINDERNVHPVCGQTQAADSVCGLNALLGGEKRAHRRVGYKNSVSRFHMLNMSKCNQIKNDLKHGTYKPDKGELHEVYEPKYRITKSSKYKDRVPQASFVTNYFYPHVIPSLIHANCACIKGRGVDEARRIFKTILKHADINGWCVKADMSNYFGSIDHQKLYEELGEYMPDEWAFDFFKTTVENTDSDVGLDLGSEVYQLAATSFLNKLDHLLDNENYIRYQDDLIVVGTKEECIGYLKVIRAEADRLGLKISEKKTYIQPLKRPVTFLGFTFLKHPNNRITLKRLPEKVRREIRKLRRMKAKGIPLERVESHYRGARECLRKGTRSDLMKMDRFYKQLFGG